MGRHRRVHIPDAFVHVSQRCHNGAMLLLDDPDKDRYLTILAQVAEHMHYEIVSFCLQDNHFHFVLKTPPLIENHTLAQFMHAVNNRFSHQYNLIHFRSGTVWNARYHASGWLSCRQVAILLVLLWYVEGNTARRHVKPVVPRQWKWCSAYYLFNGRRPPCHITLSRYLPRLFGPECRDPVAEFDRLLAVQRPDWHRLARHAPFLALDRPQTVRLRHNLRTVAETVHNHHLRSWKREVEHYSILLQPHVSIMV